MFLHKWLQGIKNMTLNVYKSAQQDLLHMYRAIEILLRTTLILVFRLWHLKFITREFQCASNGGKFK